MRPFDMSEFIEPKSGEEPGASAPEPAEAAPQEEETAEEVESSESSAAPELDVQKAVVEELAAEKVKMEHEIAELKQALTAKQEEAVKLSAEVSSMRSELGNAHVAMDALRSQLEMKGAEIHAIMERQFDQQERNPNSLALLDRDVDLPDRFPGETRDHVLEVIKEARARAEADGKIRKAQILESVLVANEPNGTLAEKRAELEKIFASNNNLVSGEVMQELARLGLSHKNGEEYLTPDEIMKRHY